MHGKKIFWKQFQKSVCGTQEMINKLVTIKLIKDCSSRINFEDQFSVKKFIPLVSMQQLIMEVIQFLG